MEVHRPDAVLAWIGHSARVALQHYAPGPPESDYQKAAQNPVQSRAVLAMQEPSTLHESSEKRFHSLEDDENQYPRQGENKPGFTREKRKGRGAPGTESGTRPASGRQSRKGGAR
jgi:hypothetical protein